MSRTIVVQPGSHHLWRTAAALDRDGMLAAYVTGILYRPDRFPYTLLSALPRALRRRLERELSRRRHQELDAAPIVVAGAFEWAHLAAIRLGAPSRLIRVLIDARNARISSVAGRAAVRDVVPALWGALYGSREAFRAAKRCGTHCVLDAFIGHPRSLNMTLGREAARFPDTASVSQERVRPYHLARIEEEVELADTIVVGSEFARDTYIENGVPADRIRIIPYGVDVQQFMPRHEKRDARHDKEFHILFVGNVSVRKGCHILIRAIRELDLPNLRLTLVGPMEHPYFMQFLGTRIEWLPAVPHGEMPSVYRRADAYVFPSLFEGSSLSVYEALASGLPVVTTRESGSVVRDETEGLIIPAGDPVALAAAIARIARDASLRDRMGRVSRKRAMEYTWEKYYERVVELVRSLEDKRQMEKEKG